MFDLASGSPSSASDYTAIIAAAIAAVAVILAAWEGWQSRRHARLSVKPSLYLHLAIPPAQVTLSMTNGGLGPAIIQRVGLSIAEEEISMDNVTDYTNGLTEALPDLIWHAYQFHEEEVVPVGRTVELIVHQPTEEDEEVAILLLIELLEHTEVSVTYRDFYNVEYSQQISLVRRAST